LIVLISTYGKEHPDERRQVIGLDVHQATISATILDSAGKLVMKATLETKAKTILQFIRGLCGSVHVTLEDGTCEAWQHDLQTAK
jgi:hypothetical protein